MSLWGLFGKDPKELFLDYNPMGSYWRVVTWNFDLKNPSTRRWTTEIHGTKVKTIHWDRNVHEEVSFYEGQKILRKRRIPEGDDELKTLMNIALHSTLKYSLEKNHEFMTSPVSGATTLDMQNEAKALAWIQATFGTLTRALDSLAHKNDLILTGACFSGTTPDTQEEVLRVIAFNLDIFYYLRDDKSLQIVVFDDKNLGHGESKSPTFQQTIKVQKPQFYDEMTKLLHRLAQVGEI